MPRPGPLGRLARLGLAAVFALTFLSIFDWRLSAHFRNPHILTEPLAWLLHSVLFVLFIALIGTLAGPGARRRWQLGAVVAAIAVVAVAVAVTWVLQGTFWGFPIADLVWWFDVLMLVEQFVALILAVALRTPGCEIGVWAGLWARTRGQEARAETGLACIVGLHLLDAWEARRSARA